jgi:protein translocase subunit secA 1
LNKIKEKLIDRQNEKYRLSLDSRVQEIRKYIEEFENLSDDDIRIKFIEYYTDFSLERLYALGTIVIDRLTGLKLFDEQLQGAICLYENRIAQLNTGQGKTITSALPVLVKAMSHKGVHVVTVNEYLAERDKTYLEPIYSYFGLTTSLNLQQDSAVEKREHYKADIMYCVASTLGFDYLNDNMVTNNIMRVNQRDFNYALIDEVDLVLIDEARTPLIISRPVDEANTFCMKAQDAIETLESQDYEIDWKSRSIWLTESGIKKINDFYMCSNIFDKQHIKQMHFISQALLANFVYKKEIDYTLTTKNGIKSVTIIDAFTGRLQHGRRFNDGLHLALETKHLRDGVTIQDENTTVATITLQNFFRLYDNLAGMSGTVHEEQSEFMEIYNLPVVVVPPHQPDIREDTPVMFFKDKASKWGKVIELVEEHHRLKNPVLISTTSVEDSILLSKLLKERKLKHKVLNAKQDMNEAKIIAKAGEKYKITVATNMAGRGTDIKVDPEFQLVIIMTELNDASRIDRQLKGRTGRQGARGTIYTVISAEDTIFRKTNTCDRLKKLNMSTSQITKFVSTVQEELEANSYSTRLSSLKYDDIIREQRNIFYNTRNRVLDCSTSDEIISILSNITNLSEDICKEYTNSNATTEVGQLQYLQDMILFVLDENWITLIDALESLKNGIHWRSQSGHNPIIIYQNEAQKIYDEFVNKIRQDLRSKIGERD